MRLSKRIALLFVVMLFAHSVAAQEQKPERAPDRAPSSSEPLADLGWVPLGPLPVDQAGAGRRGYVLSGESANVTAPGESQISIHTVAANDFYREETDRFLISQRAEAHTLAIGYRRGFKVAMFPRFEVGAQVQFNQSDEGMLNGLISGFERSFASMTGAQSATNQLRLDPATLPPLGTFITKDGRSIYAAPGDTTGLGDFSIVAKALLREGAVGDAHVAARVGLNLAGRSQFSEGNFAGVGLSVDKRMTGWAAIHADVRANFFLDTVSQWGGLPLKRQSYAFSIGPELKIARNTSFSFQIDGSTTPYLPTGTLAFDQDYGDVTFGLSQRFGSGQRHVLAQIYARENMNMPFKVRWNTDPDLSLGIKVTIQ